jgi:hypothetical protein
MATLERTALIDVPAAAVWAVLAEFDSISTWAGFVDHSCLMSEQTAGVGMARRIQMGRITVIETVTAWEPGAMISYALTGLPPVIRSVTNTWRLGASGDSTMVSLTTEVDAGPRPPQQVAGRVVGRKLGDSSDEMLTGLNAYLTGERAS